MSTAEATPDLYKLLGARRNSTPEAIAKKYRAKAKACHPDTHPNDPNAAEKFKAIQRAFSVLSDPERRARYDATGDARTELPDNIGNEAIECLTNVLRMILGKIVESGSNPAHKDLVVLMCSEIGNKVMGAKSQTSKLEKSKREIQDCAKRFEVEPGHSNVLSAITMGTLGEIENLLESLAKDISTGECALAILKFYSFKVDREFSDLSSFGRFVNGPAWRNSQAFS